MTENDHTDSTRRVNKQKRTQAKIVKPANVAKNQPKTERRRRKAPGVKCGMVLPRKHFQSNIGIGDSTFNLWKEMGLPVYEHAGTDSLIITDDLVAFLRAHPEFLAKPKGQPIPSQKE